MVSFLEFEKPVAELEARIIELRQTASVGDIDISGDALRFNRIDCVIGVWFCFLSPDGRRL